MTFEIIEELLAPHFSIVLDGLTGQMLFGSCHGLGANVLLHNPSPGGLSLVPLLLSFVSLISFDSFD